jgi:hypothetical protein
MATVMDRLAALILSVIATVARGPRGSRDREREAGHPLPIGPGSLRQETAWRSRPMCCSDWSRNEPGPTWMAALRGDELQTSLQRLVHPGPLALEVSGCVRTGLCLRDETVRDGGTDSGLTGDTSAHGSGAAGVRICACRRRRADQRERQHYGGECCWLSHSDSLRGSILWPGRSYARVLSEETRSATVFRPCCHGSCSPRWCWPQPDSRASHDVSCSGRPYRRRDAR